jgi:hypothetical protein
MTQTNSGTKMQGLSRLLLLLLLLLTACTTTAQEEEERGADQEICQSDEDGECRNDEQEADLEEEEEDVYDVWESGMLWEMNEHLDCDAIIDERNEEGRMHDDENWRSLQETYKQVVGLENASIPAVFDRAVTGYQVPIYIDFAKEEEVGRGVFAKELIPRGTLVWQSTMTAKFENGQDFREFLKRLPPELACDVLSWAYTRKMLLSVKESPKLKRQGQVICVDLDEGSYTNSGMTDFQCSIGFADKFSAKRASGCDLEFYSNRDILAEEEMRLDYLTFAELGGWKYLGLS